MRKYDLIIFDLDGTILNTLEDLTSSLNVVLANHGYPRRTLSEVRGFVGNGIRLLIERALPDGIPDATLDRLYQDFIQYYGQHCADQTGPYEGIPELLQEVRSRGYRTAVVSNKADSAVKMLCNQYFNGLFDMVVGERDGIPRKPAPDSVNQILDSLQITRERTVYIGDSDVDIATARNAGMDGIIVTWGFKDLEFLREMGAECLVSEPKEIWDLI